MLFQRKLEFAASILINEQEPLKEKDMKKKYEKLQIDQLNILYY